MKKIFIVIFALICISLTSKTTLAKNNTPFSDAELIAKVIYLENGGGSLKERALTGIALYNRAMYCPWCPNDIYDCIMQKAGSHWQYAKSTRDGLYDAPVTKSNLRIAKKALRGGYKTPHNMIYQGRSLNGKLYYKSKNGEIFGRDIGWT